MRPSLQRFADGHATNTLVIAIVVSAVIVTAAAALGRAVHNLQGAVTMKPDLAPYMLLPEERIGDLSLLRSTETERHYLAQTKSGPKLIVLKLSAEKKEWTVSTVESLREGATP